MAGEGERERRDRGENEGRMALKEIRAKPGLKGRKGRVARKRARGGNLVRLAPKERGASLVRKENVDPGDFPELVPGGSRDLKENLEKKALREAGAPKDPVGFREPAATLVIKIPTAAGPNSEETTV